MRHRAFFLPIGIGTPSRWHRSRLIQDIYLPLALFPTGPAIAAFFGRKLRG
jgi:hypothetical protein